MTTSQLSSTHTAHINEADINEEMRKHPFTCTRCLRTFEKFKHMRKHWDGKCTACSTPLSSPPSSPAPPQECPTQRQQIDPTLNLWLNNDDDMWLKDPDEPYSRLEDTIVVDDDDDNDSVLSDSVSIPEITSPTMNELRDKLLYTLLDVVEKISDRVLGKQIAMPPQVGSDTVHCKLPMSTRSPTLQTSNNWTKIPGKPKVGTNKPVHNPIETSNMYEILHSLPTSSEIPANTLDTTISQFPRRHQTLPVHRTSVLQAQAAAPAHKVQPAELSAALATALAAAPVHQPKPPVTGHRAQPTVQAGMRAPPVVRSEHRPQVVINNKPEAHGAAWHKTVPGNSSFASAVKNGQKVALFSDSICNRMNKNELRKKLQCNINKKAFPGATTEDMYEHYMMPTLKRNTPDTAIIHIGVNDILSKGTPDGGMTANSIEQIAKDVIRCGEVCQSAGVNNICISSILSFRGRRAQSTINHINHQLAKLCSDNSYDFILNDNITYDSNNTLYYGDGLHLNDDGRDILMDNFRIYLNKD